MLIKKKKQAKKNGVINYDALSTIYPDRERTAVPTSQTQVKKLSQEEINAQAHDLIEARAGELFKQYQADVEAKRSAAEKEIAVILENAKSQAQAEAELITSNARRFSAEEQAKISAAYAKLEKAKEQLQLNVENEMKKAYDAGIAKAEPQINELVMILTQFNKAQEKILNEVKPQIASIAIDVAKQLLGYEVEHNPNLIEDQVNRSVAKLMNTKGVMQIFLAPEDAKHADYLNGVLSKLLDSSVRLIFVKDETVDRGSCLINTQGGRLDARFSTQLELIKVIFEKYLGHKIVDIQNLVEQQDAGPQIEDQEMAKRIIKPNKNFQLDEPSDDDLDLLEDSEDDLLDLDDEDLDTLLQDVMPEKKDKKKKIEGFKVDHDDAKDLGANDFANGDDVDLSKAEADDEPEMEEFNEFAEDDNFGDDSNFDGSQMDDRFPEY